MKKKSRKKWIFFGGGGALLLIILIVANMQHSGRGEVTVQSRKAFTTDVVSKVSGSGTVQPKTQVNIVSEATAEIISIPVEEGDYVRRGQVLIQLDTVQLKKDMESAMYSAQELEARLEGAKVILDQRQEEYDRQKGLYDKKLTSEQAYKDAYYAFLSQKSDYAAIEQQQKAAFSRLDKAQDLLGKTTIRAPMNGVITWLDAEVGEIAQAQTGFTQGKTLMILSDMSTFEVEAEIDETDIADLEVGQPAEVEIDAFPDTTFSGKVTDIGNTATTSALGTNDQAINFKVKVQLTDVFEKIRPGMSATVDITTNQHEHVLATLIQAMVMREFDPDSLKQQEADPQTTESGGVAMASVVQDTSGNPGNSGDDEKKIEKRGVFIIQDGVAKFKEVETGIADQQNIEILSGLSEGDEVITGSFKVLRTLKDGDKVKVDNSMLNRERQQ